MVLFRVIKKVISFILYQLPKKWLIMIIFSLLMVFGLTQVKALDINSPNYVQFSYTNSWGNTSTYKITCDYPCIIRPDTNNSSYYSCYSASDDTTKINVAYYVNGTENYNGGGSQFLGSMSSASMTNFSGGGDIAFYSKEGTLMYSHTNVINPSITTTTTVVRNYTFATLDIDGGNVIDASKLVGAFLNYNYMGSDYRLNIDNYLTFTPAGHCTWSIPRAELLQDMAIASGRVLTFELEAIIAVEGGRDFRYYSLGSYTLNPSSTQANAVNQDQNLANLENINSSINETNDFLQDTNVTTNDKTINSPTIPNADSSQQIDTTFTNLFSTLEGFLGDSYINGVNIYIPDMRNGNILSTIYIPSNYIANKLDSINLFFLPNRTMLDLVYVVWYVLFTVWFLVFGTNLITMLYSGLIMQEEGLEKLTDTYTGITKDMF